MNKKIISFILSFIVCGTISFAQESEVHQPCGNQTGYNENTTDLSIINAYNVCVSQEQCRSSTNYTPSTTNQAIITAYSECLGRTQNSVNQPVAPVHPGQPPVYNCSGKSGNDLIQCQTLHESNMTAYQQAVDAYQLYLNNQQTLTNLQTASTTKLLEDVAAKQQKAIEDLRAKSQMLKTIGMLLIAAGTAILFFAPYPGGVMIAAGAVLLVYGMVTANKANKLVKDKDATCVQYDKIATKPINCPSAQQQTVDGVIPISTSTSGTGLPEFIDPVTGLCRPGAPVECKTITKNLPAGCFQKGGACLAGGKTKPQVVANNGKITMNLNGKQRTFGLEDFESEASMIKAGFTPAQAKQFISDMNSPNSILAKNGLNTKGELKGMSVTPMSSGTSASGSNSSALNTMKTEKDNYGPAQERIPASAEGLVKDYHGDTIGVDGDDVFKMIKRRYILKQHQNIFIEQ